MVKPKEGSLEALQGNLPIDELTPKAIHGFITRAYAVLFGFTIKSDMSEDSLTLTLHT
jgi:hypothetical protein